MTSFLSQKKTGFTLVELLVSIGVFSVIMTLAAGAYLIMVGLNHRAQAIALTADNLSFVFENMTREMRTGVNYSADGTYNCINGNTFSFTDAAGDTIRYRCNGTAIEEKINGGDWFALTDPNVTIDAFALQVTDAANTTALNFGQPYVRITIQGTAAAESGKTFSFAIQTSASMRGINL